MTGWAPWQAVEKDRSASGLGRSEAQVRRRFAASPHGRGFWIALWTVAGIAELLALRPVIFDREAPIVGLDVVFTLVGGSFAAFGLVGWRRRPDSRSGLLMTATGFAFFVSPLLGQVDGSVAFTAYTLLVDCWIYSFVALLLTLLTSGRLRSRFDRWLVAAYAVPLVFLQLVWMLFARLEGGNLLLAFEDEQIAHALDRTQRGLLGLVCVVTIVVICARWWATSRPRRRALLPSLAGALTLVFFTALLAVGARESRGAHAPARHHARCRPSGGARPDGR